MMADTLLFAFLVTGLLIFLLYAFIKWEKINKKKFRLSLILILLVTSIVFFFTGFKKIKSDIARIIHNSAPKSPSGIYHILFKKSPDSCVNIINCKDQVIPKIDCCIWMEVTLCPSELKRISGLRKYTASVYPIADAAAFLQSFGNRPAWWLPQQLGDSVTQLKFIFNANNQQSIFFGADSSRVFICDQAL